MGLKGQQKSVSITGGIFRGRKIPLPPAVHGHRHTTPGLVKEAVFQLLENRGYARQPFWDLCGGSGQMALEALSRGFEPVHLVELDRGRFHWLRQVVRDYKVRLHNKDFLRTLPLLTAGPQRSVCYLDLPYSFWQRDGGCEKLQSLFAWLQSNDPPLLPLLLVQAPRPFDAASMEPWIAEHYKAEQRDYRGQWLLLYDPEPSIASETPEEWESDDTRQSDDTEQPPVA
ncbi:MAG: RsmD family RNA methyltransferase [Leptospiraceae bacterium]|nr:RsmD family RNA methyltransferase [Leptospiraceae bacterium]